MPPTESEPKYAPSRADTTAGWCVCFTLVACTVAWSFNLVSFLHAKELVLVIGLIPLAVFRAMSANQVRASALTPLWILLFIALFVGFIWPRAAVSLYVIEEGVRLCALLLFATLAWPLLAEARWRERVLDALVIAGAVVSLLALMQYKGWLDSILPTFEHYDQRAYSVFGNQGLLGGFIAMALPAAMRRRSTLWTKWGSGIFILILACGLLVSFAISAFLAVASAFLVLLILVWDRQWRGLSRLGLNLLVIAPVLSLMLWRIPFSMSMLTGIHSRLWFWDGAVRMIADAPVLGVGLGNFQYHSPAYLGEALAQSGPDGFYNRLHTIYAHCDPLQLLAETGIAGGLLLFWWGICIFRMRKQISVAPEDTITWASLAALFVFSCFYFPFHSAPHALAGLLLVGCLVARGEKEVPQRFKLLHLGSMLAVCSLYFWVTLMPSFQRVQAEDTHLRGENPISQYKHAIQSSWPAQPYLYESYGMALFDAGRYREAYTQFTNALVGLDTGRIHLLLGETALGIGEDDAALSHFKNCLARWPFEENAFHYVYDSSEGQERELWKAHGLRWGLLSEEDQMPSVKSD